MQKMRLGFNYFRFIKICLIIYKILTCHISWLL